MKLNYVNESEHCGIMYRQFTEKKYFKLQNYNHRHIEIKTIL